LDIVDITTRMIEKGACPKLPRMIEKGACPKLPRRIEKGMPQVSSQIGEDAPQFA
jgi:hypothetical protein